MKRPTDFRDADYVYYVWILMLETEVEVTEFGMCDVRCQEWPSQTAGGGL